MPIHVRIPTPLRRFTGGAEEVGVAGNTVGAVVNDLERQFSGIKERLCDEEGRVRRFVEKDDAFRGSAWVNGGLYAFDPALWRKLPQGASSLERDVMPPLAAAGALRGYRSPGSFFDIGTPEEWERAERRFGT